MKEKGGPVQRQKRMAVINDFSGFGRCSLTVSIPIISAMKIQCCGIPTAIFSNHTGYEEFFFDDYTDKMREYYRMWEKLGLTFDGIYTGFLGSVRQVELVEDFIHRFAAPQTVIVVDPVMGDNGRRYATVDDALCEELKKLIPLATILTPNLTEACLLAGTGYRENGTGKEELLQIAVRLREQGAGNLVITGIRDGDTISDFIFREDGSADLLSQPVSGTPHAGTGDVFASIVAADAVNGVDFRTSVRKAGAFVGRAIALSDEMHIPTQDGVCFEEILSELTVPGFSCEYEH